MKVLLINNYPMDKAYETWQNGECPSQHLWGKIEFDKRKKIDIIILKHEKYKFLNFLGNLFRIQYLDQQIRILWILRKIDIIYAPYAGANTKFLILLKLFKLISKPIVILVHVPMFGYKSNSRIKKFIAKKIIMQYDAVVFLARALQEDVIKTLCIPKSVTDRKFFHANWGADTVLYKNYKIPMQAGQTGFAISAGKTDRDYETIVEAFRDISFPLKIYCTPESRPQNKNIPENVTICTTGISFTDLLKEYNKARVILIPLKSHKGGTQGLTSLIDVYPMGKPVIMTYNKNIDFDLEEEGIGYWAEQDSVDSWRTILNRILRDEKLLEVMGANSMRIFRKKCNSELFADEIEEIFYETQKHTKGK